MGNFYEEEEDLATVTAAYDLGQKGLTSPPTKVMHLPPGAIPKPSQSPVGPAKRSPAAVRAILTLIVINVFLWSVAAMYWLLNWEDIFRD